MKQQPVQVEAHRTGGGVEKNKQATRTENTQGEKIMQAAGEADEPEEAMREAARPVEKMMNKRMKQQPVQVEAHRTGGGVEKNKQAARTENTQGEKHMQAAGEADEPEEAMKEAARPASLVEKILRAADKADEPNEAKRANGECDDTCDDGTCCNSPKYCGYPSRIKML